jgi:hypothetical protein
MKKIIILFTLLLLTKVHSQCDIKTTNRPDGVTIKYFTPKPVAIGQKHETGLSLYFNKNTKQYTLTIFVLHKTSNKGKTTGNLILQTTNNVGISLTPYISKIIDMNGNDVTTTIYYLTKKDITELKTYNLKTIAFTINGEIIGMTVTQNKDLLTKEFNCLNK